MTTDPGFAREVSFEAETGFVVKDSGARKEFASGMVRDTEEGKTDYSRVLEGPMFDRWAEHLSKGAVKYPDVRPGVANWTLASGEEEETRFKKSALRHFIQWFRGQRDEDHAAAVFFNINGAEYVRAKMDFERAMSTARAIAEAKHDEAMVPFQGEFGPIDLEAQADEEEINEVVDAWPDGEVDPDDVGGVPA